MTAILALLNMFSGPISALVVPAQAARRAGIGQINEPQDPSTVGSG